MKRLAARVLIIAALGIIMAAVVPGCQPHQVSPRPKTVVSEITIAQYGDLLLYLPLYIAQDDGIFAKHGVKVSIVSTGGDDKTFAAVASGSAQFGLADPTFVAIAREQGQTGRVIGLLIDGMPNYGVALSPHEPTIKQPRDLAGKTVATVPAPSTSYVLVKQLYAKAGLKPAIRQVAASGLVPALQAKQADYALLIEPYVSDVVSQGGHVAFSLMTYYPHYALTGLTVSQTTISTDPASVQAVVSSLAEAILVFYNDPAEALRAAEKHFPDEKVSSLQQGIERMRNDKIYPSTMATTESAWNPAIHLRQVTGDLQKAPLPMQAYIDNSFATKAASTK